MKIIYFIFILRSLIRIKRTPLEFIRYIKECKERAGKSPARSALSKLLKLVIPVILFTAMITLIVIFPIYRTELKQGILEEKSLIKEISDKNNKEIVRNIQNIIYSAWIKTTVFDGNEKFNGEYF